MPDRTSLYLILYQKGLIGAKTVCALVGTKVIEFSGMSHHDNIRYYIPAYGRRQMCGIWGFLLSLLHPHILQETEIGIKRKEYRFITSVLYQKTF